MYCFRAHVHVQSVVLPVTELNMLVHCTSCPSGWANCRLDHPTNIKSCSCLLSGQSVWWYAAGQCWAEQLCTWPSRGDMSIVIVHLSSAPHTITPWLHGHLNQHMWSSCFFNKLSYPTSKPCQACPPHSCIFCRRQMLSMRTLLTSLIPHITLQALHMTRFAR